jgi:hypothetical protein
MGLWTVPDESKGNAEDAETQRPLTKADNAQTVGSK